MPGGWGTGWLAGPVCDHHSLLLPETPEGGEGLKPSGHPVQAGGVSLGPPPAGGAQGWEHSAVGAVRSQTLPHSV